MSKHSPTPWSFALGIDSHAIVDANGDDVIADIGCTLPEGAAERIVACVNFCQQFPTEFLVQRQLVYIKSVDQIVEPPTASDKRAIARGEMTLADIPGFDGCVAVKMLPVAKVKP